MKVLTNVICNLIILSISTNSHAQSGNGTVNYVSPVIERVCNTDASFTLHVDYTTTIPGQQVMIDFVGPEDESQPSVNIRTTISPSAPESMSNVPMTITIPTALQPLKSGIYKARLFLRHTSPTGGGVFSSTTEIDIPVTTCGEHPYLMVKEDMYPTLRQKESAGKPLSYIIGASSRWSDVDQRTSQALNYCIIAYILETDETIKSNIRARILDILDKWETEIPLLDSGSHGSYVAGTGTQFNAIIALDIIHDYITPAELAGAERILAIAADYFINTSAAWKLSGYGVNTMYALYNRNQSEITRWKSEYNNYLLDYSITNDGSWGQSPGYLYARLLGGRIAKTTTQDALEFTGTENYYNNPQLIAAYKWGATFAVTPWGGHTRFGDTGKITDQMGATVSPHFSHRYGDDIASLYYWNIRDSGPPSFSSANWVLFLNKPISAPTPSMPKSLLMEQSGAALWDKNDSQEALQGVLYSLRRDDPAVDQFGHDLFDANTFDIVGYGEHMVMNSGVEYVGLNGQGGNYPGYAPDNKRWSRAILHNTVLIGNKTEHDQRDGGGLIDGVIGGNIEFGTTTSGPAISNGRHDRTMHFIHPISGQSNGYFVIHDEVTPNSANDKVDINFQVNTKRNGTSTVTANQEYSAPIDATVVNGNDLQDKVTLFFGSSPNINIVTSYKGSFDVGSAESDNIRATYNPAADGVVRATTIIFPEDETHSKPAMQKISSSQFAGVKLSHSNTFVDQYLGASPSVENLQEGVSFKASTTFFRKDNGITIGYSSTNATKFLDPDIGGFTSNQPISIVMEGLTGHLNVQSNTEVTFHREFLTKVQINGTIVNPANNFADAVTINLTPGRHTVELIAEAESAKYVAPLVKDVCNSDNPITLYINYTTTAPGQKVMIDLKYGGTNTNIKRTVISPSVPESRTNFPVNIDIPAESYPLQDGEYNASLFVRSNKFEGGGVFRGGEDSTLDVIPGDCCSNITSFIAGSWSNGAPAMGKTLILNEDYNTANGNLSACSLIVKPGATLTVGAGESVTVQNGIDVQGTMNVDKQSNVTVGSN